MVSSCIMLMAEWAGLRRRTCTRAKPALPPRPGLLRHERSVLSTSHDKKAPVCQHFYTPVNECVSTGFCPPKSA